MDASNIPMVEFERVCEHLHGPLLPLAAQHGLQLVLMEALERVQRKGLAKAVPADRGSQYGLRQCRQDWDSEVDRQLGWGRWAGEGSPHLNAFICP